MSKSVTQLLEAWNSGDQTARDELVRVVYQELHGLAQRYLRRERPNHSLQATALVNEAYLRLVDQRDVEWRNRQHFVGVAAEMMRRILVDHARRQHRTKRGGGDYKLSLSKADRLTTEPSVNLIDLDEALARLSLIDPQRSRMVELRFFGGLSIEETAEILKTSTATVERDWRVAKAFLRREISPKSDRQ
ncbi:MAG TPA: sigma-70 family RNA polymerase sigma factor [Pyrinomonadaceae bacterium]|nr:sigma-70 family RNA polymerase sigma factor [Pyrinomonadaceae bacterium]